MAERVGIGIIGFGGWPRTAYTPVLRDLEGAEVVAVSARTDQTIATAREALSADVVGYRNYHDLLEDERVDAVMVATPDALHREVASWALQAVKHVFVEPPFGETLDQAVALLDEADEYVGAGPPRRVFQGDLELGYIPALQRIRAMLSGGLLGDPLSVSVRLWCDWGLAGQAGSREASRVGVFVWVGPWYIHVLDVLLGRLPRRVSVAGGRAANGPLMDHGWASFEYGDEKTGRVIGRYEFNLLAPADQDISLEVVGTRGEARADLCSGEVRTRTTDAPAWQVEQIPPAQPIAAFAGMRECIGGFVRAITHGEPVLADVAACRRVHEVCFAAQRAADDGIAVELRGGE